MAETSDGSFTSLSLDSMLDDGDMFWETVTRKNARQRSDSEGDSVVSVITKRSKASKPLRNQDDVWKVVIVFLKKGGPDLQQIHITKAIEKAIGKINHARFMGNGRLLIFANSEEQQSKILKKTSLNNLKITSHI